MKIDDICREVENFNQTIVKLNINRDQVGLNVYENNKAIGAESTTENIHNLLDCAYTTTFYKTLLGVELTYDATNKCYFFETNDGIHTEPIRITFAIY